MRASTDMIRPRAPSATARRTSWIRGCPRHCKKVPRVRSRSWARSATRRRSAACRAPGFSKMTGLPALTALRGWPGRGRYGRRPAGRRPPPPRGARPRPPPPPPSPPRREGLTALAPTPAQRTRETSGRASRVRRRPRGVGVGEAISPTQYGLSVVAAIAIAAQRYHSPRRGAGGGEHVSSGDHWHRAHGRVDGGRYPAGQLQQALRPLQRLQHHPRDGGGGGGQPGGGADAALRRPLRGAGRDGLPHLPGLPGRCWSRSARTWSASPRLPWHGRSR